MRGLIESLQVYGGSKKVAVTFKKVGDKVHSTILDYHTGLRRGTETIADSIEKGLPEIAKKHGLSFDDTGTDLIRHLSRMFAESKPVKSMHILKNTSGTCGSDQDTVIALYGDEHKCQKSSTGIKTKVLGFRFGKTLRAAISHCLLEYDGTVIAETETRDLEIEPRLPVIKTPSLPGMEHQKPSVRTPPLPGMEPRLPGLEKRVVQTLPGLSNRLPGL